MFFMLVKAVLKRLDALGIRRTILLVSFAHFRSYTLVNLGLNSVEVCRVRIQSVK